MPHGPYEAGLFRDFFQARMGKTGQNPLFSVSLPEARAVLRESGGGNVFDGGLLDFGPANPEIESKYGTRTGQCRAEDGCIPESWARVSSKVIEDDRNKEIVAGMKQRSGPHTL